MKGLSDLEFRTERLWHMLCKVVQASANRLDLFEPWVRNVGMNSSHISSLTAILQKWGMLVNTTRGGIVLSSRIERYRLLIGYFDKRNDCQVLRKLILAVDKADVALATLVTPRTPRQWVLFFKVIQNSFVRTGIPCLQACGNDGKKEKYIFAFTARGVMISRMPGEGVTELLKISDCSLTEFASIFP